MRRRIVLLFCVFLGGCATFNDRVPPAATNAKVVVAEGTAPIVNGDIAGAKKASLDEAMKNALGLVIGVYVSQESLVSKVLLLEDTILTRTKGYIERYSILRESQEGGFYKTAIRAEVRKDNLSAAFNAAAMKSRLRALSVKISMDETVDGTPSSAGSAHNAMKIAFADTGFTVTESTGADILISGKAAANLVPITAAFGFISYRTVLSLTAARSGSAEAITVVQETDGGADVTREAAASASLVNAAKKAARDLTENIIKTLQEHSVIRLTIINVTNITCLNNILRSVRSLAAVKDCRVRSFSGDSAEVDLDVEEGAAFDIARHLERLSSVKIIIKQAKPDVIRAICLFSNDF